MNTRLFILTVLLGGIFLASAPARSADDFTADSFYKQAVTQLLVNPVSFNYGDLRSLYIRTSQYDPLGDKIKDKMLRLSFETLNARDPLKSLAALTEYNELVRLHLAHIGIVAQAQSLAAQDKRFGDPAFFLTVRNGLLTNVKASGDGLSLARAYEVITMDEETALLTSLNVEVVDSQTNKEGVVYYNMHSVIGAGNRPYTVFVNLTRPMMFLEEQESRKGNSFSLRPR